MGTMKPISKETVDSREKFTIKLGSNGRMILSSELRKELNIHKGGEVYVFFDEEDRRIGLSDQCPQVGVTPFNVDKRGYVPAKGFIKLCRYDTSTGSIPFVFEGQDNNIYVFREKGRIPVTMKMEQNGNLERAGRR